MQFDLDRGGFEPHTIWLQGGFDERTRRLKTPNFAVPTRRILRYRIQVSNLTSSGAGFFANIQPTDCAINVSEQYVEIVPLQSITYSLAPVLVQLGLHPPIVQMDCEVGFYVASFGETLYPAGGGTYVAPRGYWTTTYTQSLATQPYILPPIPPVIYLNGVVQTTGYTINTVEGSVTFSPVPLNSPTVTADLTYVIPDNVRDATVAQVTYLLGMRNLNKQGMQGLGMARNADVEIRTTESYPARFQTDTGALCDASAHKLMAYIAIPVA
jgi:hypothetical protein